MTTTNKQEIINAFLNGATVIDNHDDREIKLEAVIEFNDKEDIAAFVANSRYQCLNRLYLHTDGTLHLSQLSIGGTVMGNDFDNYNESVIFESARIKRVIYQDGHEEYPKQPGEQPEEQEETQDKLSTLKSELEDLLVDEEEVDTRIRDLHKLVVNIRHYVKEDSKTYKIADKLAAMCRETSVDFDSDILPLLRKAISVMDLDLQDNDILEDRHNPYVAHYIKTIEVKFL